MDTPQYFLGGNPLQPYICTRKRKVKGNGIVPFFYSEKRRFRQMDQSAALNNIKQFLENFIAQWPEVFLVDLAIGPSNKITLLLDADNGMNIARCADVNRSLYKYIEKENLFGGSNFSLEVSSPGVDRPLTSLRQYQKNVGRNVEVKKNDGSEVQGKLITAEEKSIVIEETLASKKKHSETKKTEIPFTEIRQVKVLVTF